MKLLIFTNLSLSTLLIYNDTVFAFYRAVLPADHPAYGRIVRVANRILKSNLDVAEIKKKNWTVTVIDEVII